MSCLLAHEEKQASPFLRDCLIVMEMGYQIAYRYCQCSENNA